MLRQINRIVGKRLAEENIGWVGFSIKFRLRRKPRRHLTGSSPFDLMLADPLNQGIGGFQLFAFQRRRQHEGVRADPGGRLRAKLSLGPGLRADVGLQFGEVTEPRTGRNDGEVTSRKGRPRVKASLRR